MRFINIDGQMVNDGLIVDMSFDPGADYDTEDESWQKYIDREDLYGDHVKTKPYARARVYVLGREFIEVREKAKIDALREFWNNRTILEI